MQRRRFLQSAGLCGTAAIAGCTNGPPEPSGISVRLDEQPPDIRYAVEVESPPTVTTPLTLQITISNPDETATVRYGERRRALFWIAEVDAPFGTYPHAGVRETLEYAEDRGAWQLPDPFAITMDYQWGVLGPGEAHTERVVMVNTPMADPPVAVTDRESIAARTDIVIERESSDERTEAAWGFELVMQN
jgi:hypothetical protein